MTLVNVKTKQDLIKLKKNLIKRAEEEKLKDFLIMMLILKNYTNQLLNL